MLLRPAAPADAEALSGVLQELIAAGKRSRPGDAELARTHYISGPDQITCSLAFDDSGLLLGFQSLKIAREGNPYDTPEGWGIIGTHVRPSAARRGVGSALFRATRDAALAAGLERIEAYIRESNAAALAYYEAQGFRSWRRAEGVDCKVCLLS